MPSFDSGDDFVWVRGPGKGLWVCVGVVEEAVDGIFEFPQGSKYATLETLLCELGKEALDSVEPGSGCRGEVEDKPPMFFEPRHDVGMLVGGVVVDDDMDRLFLGHSGLDDVQKPDELLMAMALHALANHLALKDIERREQGGDAMALVIMGYGASAPLLHRQTRLGAIKRLNLALLIDRQDNGVVGRIDVEADDLVQFGGKLRIVGQLELTHPVRLEAMSTPYPLHRADANPGRLRHRRTAPVTGRRWRASQGQGDHTFSHLRAQRWNARPSCLVPPKANGSFVAETFLPAPDHRLGLSGGLHDLSGAVTVGRQKDDLCPPNVLLRAIAVGNHCFKLAAVSGVQSDIRSLVHPLDSHTRVLQGIPKRIEMLDLVH